MNVQISLDEAASILDAADNVINALGERAGFDMKNIAIIGECIKQQAMLNLGENNGNDIRNT